MHPTLNSIYVINVKKFTERRFFIESQLSKFNLHAEFIQAWDIEDLSPEITDTFFSTEKLSKGQMSCAMKHITALQHISKNTSELSLVLEDDVIFSNDFEQGLSNALRESVNFHGNKVIFIGSGGNFYTPKSKRIAGQHLYIGNRGRFADSYIIDSTVAKLRLEWIEANKVSHPIDNQFEIIDKELDIQMLWLEDPIIEQGSKTGLFNSSLEPAPPQWLQKIFFNWEKLKRKHIYQLWK
jgi:glycosyl transferase family 25